MDPVGSPILSNGELVAVNGKKNNKLKSLLQTVREKAATSPLRSMRKAKLLSQECTTSEPPSKPSSSRTIAPTVTWSPTQLQEAKKTIQATLEELVTLIPKTRLSQEEKQRHAFRYLKGLRVIIEKRVCHSDLKPENILWSKNSFVISDFNGAFFIDRVSDLMDTRFVFESEQEKTIIRTIVQQKPLKTTHEPSLKKLAEWGIYSNNQLLDPKKLRQLKEYVAIRFLPPPTKGYASDRYRDAMCNYFWRCEKENFALACQAFDMRAAALTIYAILTGTQPPAVEDDKAYYDTLEHSLVQFGLSKKAASSIRKMAEPVVPPLGEPFTLPITLMELSRLELELCPEESPCVQIESSEDEDNVEELESVRVALSALQIVKKDDKSIIKEIIKDLSSAKTGHINADIRLELIGHAFTAYSGEACESTLTIDDKTYDTVLLIDPTDLQSCDIVCKENRIGEGGSAVAYKAFSLRTSQHVVLKYFLASANPLEAKNAKEILEHIGTNKAIQPCPKLFSLQRMEEYQPVQLEPYYENCDYASSIFGDLFCSKWKIPKEQEPIQKALKELDDRLQEICTDDSPLNEKLMHVDAFEKEYAKTFTGLLGQQKVMAFLGAYRILASATPTSRLRSPSLGIQDENSTTLLLQKCQRIYTDLIVIDTDLLRDTIYSDPSQEAALKEQAKKIMIQSIRKCQAKVFREHLEAQNVGENPVTAAKEWMKRAITFKENNLDLQGINRICKVLQMSERVKENHQSIHQRTLHDLNTIFENISTL